LFHRAARRRAAAAEGLARAMAVQPPSPPPQGQHASVATRAWIDPFGTSLRYGDPSSSAGAYTNDYTASSSPHSASSVFGSKDVHDLVKVMTGASLGPSVRCAAAGQLCICATDRRLEESIAAPSSLAALARLAASALEGDGAEADVVGLCTLKQVDP
jgi:hypothetical protein